LFTIFNKARSLHINTGDSCKAAADFNGLFRKTSQPKNCCTFTEQMQKVIVVTLISCCGRQLMTAAI